VPSLYQQYLTLVELTSFGIHSVTMWMWCCRKKL